MNIVNEDHCENMLSNQFIPYPGRKIMASDFNKNCDLKQEHSRTVWLCFFADGVPIYSTLSESQKGSIKKARQSLSIDRWKDIKSRGITCRNISIRPAEPSNLNDPQTHTKI
jgi:hypothetical protein